jgi:hypothetical protein
MAYHSDLKQRIKNNELIGFELIQDYQGRAEKMLLFFQSEPKIRPILKNKIEEYKEMLKDINTRFEQITTGFSPIAY